MLFEIFCFSLVLVKIMLVSYMGANTVFIIYKFLTRMAKYFLSILFFYFLSETFIKTNWTNINYCIYVAGW